MEDLRKNLISKKEGRYMSQEAEIDAQEEAIANQKVARIEDRIEALLEGFGITDRTTSEKTENHRFMDIVSRLDRDPEVDEALGVFNIEELLQRLATKLKSVTELVPAHLSAEGKKFHELHPKEAKLYGLLLVLYHRLMQIELLVDDLDDSEKSG